MKNKKLIIILSILLVIIIGVILCLFIFKNNDTKTTIEENKITKEEHYTKMLNKMYSYYNVMYKYINIPEDNIYSPIRINLGTLEYEGFPIDEFVSYDGKEKCDIALSFGVREYIDGEFKISVYYKCGNDINYDAVSMGNSFVPKK